MRWFPADEALRETSMDKLMPPLVAQLRRKVKEFRDSGYVGAADTSKSLLNWWFNTPTSLPQADGTMAEFQYYFAQREAVETIIYLYRVVGVKDKYRPDALRCLRRGVGRHVRRNVAAIRGQDGHRDRQDKGAESGAGLELTFTSSMSRIPSYPATSWSSRRTSSCWIASTRISRAADFL